MYAIYFNEGAGGRSFIAAVDDKHSALSMAKLLSRQDPRNVVVVENTPVGDTLLVATFHRGARQSEDADVTTDPASLEDTAADGTPDHA